MTRENDMAEELRQIGSYLADASRQMPYSVPSGYFEQAPISFIKVIGEVEQPEATPNWSKSQPHSVPQGYFEGLTGNIVANIIGKEPVQVTFKANPFSVPAGYFETLAGQMLAVSKAASKQEQKTKVIPFRPATPWRVRWAAAAVLLVTISVGSYMIFSQPAATPDRMLASVPANEIKDYLQFTDRVDVEKIVTYTDLNKLQVESGDIVNYLNETGWD